MIRNLNFNIKLENSIHQVRLQLDDERYSHQNIINSFRSNIFFENSLSLFLIRALKEGDTFYDVGAHIGYFSIFCSFLVGKTGKVIAVEPEDSNFSYLEHHIELNKNRNTIPIQGVISDVDGQLDLNINQANDGGHTLLDISKLTGNLQSEESTNTVKTHSYTLDTLINLNALPSPNVIKIDTEGAELLVINGGKKTIRPEKVPFVVCECNTTGSNTMLLRKAMIARGYQTFTFEGKDRFPKLIPHNLKIGSKWVFNILFSTIENVSSIWDYTDVYFDGENEWLAS